MRCTDASKPGMEAMSNEKKAQPAGAKPVPVDAQRVGIWASDAARHAESAQEFQRQFHTAFNAVRDTWPVPLGTPVPDAEATHPELYALVRQRDRLAVAAILFAGLAIEAFVNHYGVLRLQNQFTEQYERKRSLDKFASLLADADGVALTDNDPLRLLLVQIAASRNALAHPKTTEFATREDASAGKLGPLFPDAVDAQIQRMWAFFSEFVQRFPQAAHHVPTKD